MSEAARTELERAIKADEVVNATEYAEEFARRHGLNPVSVRSAISRLRREYGKLTRASRSGGAVSTAIESGRRVNAVTLLKIADATDPLFTRVAAAALVRYERDEAFRREVDEQRREIERIYDSLTRLQKTTAELLPEEREDLARFLATE